MRLCIDIDACIARAGRCILISMPALPAPAGTFCRHGNCYARLHAATIIMPAGIL
jgi:hypothetical protein